jgi:PadR family transcriptional regulator PadR
VEKSSLDVVRGTLDVLILKTLSWGAMHGYAISQTILRQTDEALLVEEGALYPALYRMEGKGWLEAEWGVSENNRRAKYYRLTSDGRRRLREEVKTWAHYAEAVGKVLGATSKPQWEKA